MKNTQKITLGIIGVIIIAIIGVWGFNQTSSSQKIFGPGGMPTDEYNRAKTNQNTNANSANQETTIQTSLQIDRQDGSTVKVFGVKMEKDSTALSQLQKAAVDNNITIEVKTSDFGSYVDSLDGLKGGTDGKYWLYSVNGKEAAVGADQYKLAEGDVAEWKFTK